MASSTKIALPVPLTGAGATNTKVYDDPIVVDGTLLLSYPGHSTRAWAAGVPVASDTLPNIASVAARTIIPSGGLDLVVGTEGSLFTGGRAFIERTGKGGIHVCVSQSGVFDGTSHAYGLKLPDAIVQYLADNPSHNFYWSQWAYVTRILGAGSGGVAPYASVSRIPASTLLGPLLYSQSVSDVNTVPSSANRIGESHDQLTVSGAKFWAIAGPSNEAMNTANYANLGNRSIAQWGSNLPWSWQASIRNRLPSWILYRVYCEDLTVSGRSFATVQAADFAAYTAQVKTVGGKYYGDTFTDPATLP